MVNIAYDAPSRGCRRVTQIDSTAERRARSSWPKPWPLLTAASRHFSTALRHGRRHAPAEAFKRDREPVGDIAIGA
jgi:hypothetical protein